MTTPKFKKRDSTEVQQSTLVFLVRGKGKNKEVLLAMKKRGFGEGWWNGMGGKVEPGETPMQAVHREGFEEAQVLLKEAKKVALLHFYFPEDPKKRDWNQDVHVYFATNWLGEPKETEEMKPKWFKVASIPYENMWDDDPLWLSGVLRGEKIEAWFSFDNRNKVLDYRIGKFNGGEQKAD